MKTFTMNDLHNVNDMIFYYQRLMHGQSKKEMR